MDASSKADKLLVAINSDSSVKSLKGQNRPNVPQNERAELVSALSCVDLVFIFSSLTVNPIIEKVRPSFHAKGTDYTIENIPEKEFLNKFSVTPIICGDPKDHSTTEMMKQLKKNL